MDMETLRALTELRYQKSLAGLSDLLKEEAKLRAEIQRLRDMAVDAQSLPVAQHSMRNIGADVIWLKWVAKTTKALNIELAQVLARKEAMLSQQRRALGRKSVADGLAKDARRDAKARKDAAALETSIDNAVQRRLRD